MKTETLDEESASGREAGSESHPGVVVIYSCERPRCLALPLAGDAIELGRDELAAAGLADGRVSRRHLRVERDGARWNVRDMDSRNGTFVNGRQVQSARQLVAPVVRVGRTVLLLVGDRRPYESPGVVARDGAVMGPALQSLHERVAAVARGGSNLLILGDSGAGKELAAATFHLAGGRADRPFVAVNCATIQKDLAERALFGARRGAYTGAVADAPGLVQAADGGTLFLDEVAELDPGVQAKLLRVLETREVTPLGGVQPVAVALRLCAATHKNLRAEVAAGRFREDLYFRVGRPEVRLPPLCERREEIPWLIDRALATPPGPRALVAGVDFVEACLLRAWPGNVRELLAEVTTAALAAGAHQRAQLAATDLDAEAGRAIQSDDDEPDAEERSEPAPPDPAVIEAALRAERGNVARAAARLGLSRSRVRRFIERQRIDLSALRSG